MKNKQIKSETLIELFVQIVIAAMLIAFYIKILFY